MLLHTEGLTKLFNEEFWAVRNVGLNFEKGVLTSIIGPNGAGKTTLINLLSGSLKPSAGKIFFQNQEITHAHIVRRVKLGICRSFQITNIFPKLSLLQNIQIPLISYYRRTSKLFSRLPEKDIVNKEALEILNDIGLIERKELIAYQLSHGEQRQLEIGIALATHPEIIFLDEPTQGMNKMEKSKIIKFIEDFSKRGKATFVIVEHDMDVVFSVSERIVVLHNGEVIADGNPEEITKNERVREVYLGVCT
jgi:branched-chain amino acid transport system ATP-binding protein